MTPAKAAPDMADVQMRRRHEAPEVGAMLTRMLRALARRAGEGDTEALEQLVKLQATVVEQLGAGVAGYRGKGHSWADVGRITGTSRQAAQERFGAATVDAAHGPRCTCRQAACPRLQLMMEVPINANV